jgi:hypothetical protein
MRLRSTLPFMAALTAVVNACGGPAPRAALPVPTAPIAAAPPAPVRQVDESAVDREVEARLRARLDLCSSWAPMGQGAYYLAPDDVVGKDGAVDVIVQFHGAPFVEDEWQKRAIPAVIVSVHLSGYGATQYRDMFASRDRFRGLLDGALARVGGTHVRRLALVSWSAGYGAVQNVLSDPDTYAMTDTVGLFDGMHVDYKEGLPDGANIAVFEHFARDAVAGTKQMILTHSSVTPFTYASTTETTTMLLFSLGIPRVQETRTNLRGMVEYYHADEGGLHVRGFRGEGLRDHIDQVHLLGDAVRAFIAPRWTRQAVLEEESVAVEL